MGGHMYVAAQFASGRGSWRWLAHSHSFSTQRICADTRSPRMYDEAKGNQFHVHIIALGVYWDIITSVLPPISPV
ncbi:hypothetical protein PAXRUDRAFT_831555 [Paxillus rubicundulus Ve08.2h10]|uniref:Uncharacterized protein n=1 Tax=Paxillus rubicundulus Ve08.2h10 TaxID=930991 RepID=A0A0D0D279_9AGAM|nr:hypothetical protein PAXRUDRAFT_831555 [Paxillus rubicundulus Ve08.2h10]